MDDADLEIANEEAVLATWCDEVTGDLIELECDGGEEPEA